DGIAARADHVPVTQPDERTRAFEESGQIGVLDLDGRHTGLRQSPLELGRFRRPGAERPRGARLVEQCTTPFEPEQRYDVSRPGLAGDGHTGVERVGLGDPAPEIYAEIVQPGACEHPLAGTLDPGRLAVEQVTQRRRTHGRPNRRGNLPSLEK